MHRLLLLLLLAFPVWSQETSETELEATEGSVEESTESVEEPADEAADDDEDFDVLYSEEDEEVFIPSEDVKFGQSIPFPTDI